MTAREKVEEVLNTTSTDIVTYVVWFTELYPRLMTWLGYALILAVPISWFFYGWKAGIIFIFLLWNQTMFVQLWYQQQEILEHVKRKG